MRTLMRLRGVLGISMARAAAVGVVGVVGGLRLLLALVFGAVDAVIVEPAEKMA